MPEKKYNLPKPYLSYSARSLWDKNKKQFRERYYENIKPVDTVYTLLGKEIHSAIETDPTLAHLPRYGSKEQEMNLTIADVPVRAYIDTFDLGTCSFLEYKTGIKNGNGSARWSQKEVDELKQLPFYAMLIKEKYGLVNLSTRLVALETAWREVKTSKAGIEIIFDRSLALTGVYEVFDRVLLPEELVEAQNWLVAGAEEISLDYTEWLKEYEQK